MYLLNNLVKIANELDDLGLYKESDEIDKILKESAHPASYLATYLLGDEERREKALDWTQAALDLGGFVPGYGEMADGLNVAISAYRKDPIGAILSSIAILPIFGDVIGKGAKLYLWAARTGVKVIQVGDVFYDLASLGSFLKGQISQHSPQIEQALATLDQKMNEAPGYFSNQFNSLVVNKIV